MKTVDQRNVQRTAQRQLPGDMDLIELRSGRCAAEFNVQGVSRSKGYAALKGHGRRTIAGAIATVKCGGSRAEELTGAAHQLIERDTSNDVHRRTCWAIYWPIDRRIDE